MCKRGCGAHKRGRAANNNCTTCVSGFKHKVDTYQLLSQYTITITFASQVSSELSSGRRPTSKSKSDEFCDANVVVILIEPQRCENTDFAVK